MWREYAVEPRALMTRETFRYVIENCGPGRGRMISEFPGKWRRMLREAMAECPPGDVKFIETQLTVDNGERFRRRLLSSKRAYDSKLSWVDNAIEADAERPFGAIVVRDDPGGADRLVAVDELCDLHPLWAVETQRHVQRQAASMAAAVEPMLRAAKTVRFVDPYFSKLANRHLGPLGAFLASMSRMGDGPREVEYHTGDAGGDLLANGDYPGQCRRAVAPFVPTGMSIRLVIWRQAALHKRLVLTDRGGTGFEHGLDEATGDGVETSLVYLMAESTWREEWERYEAGAEGRSRDVVASIDVKGTRRRPE